MKKNKNNTLDGFLIGGLAVFLVVSLYFSGILIVSPKKEGSNFGPVVPWPVAYSIIFSHIWVSLAVFFILFELCFLFCVEHTKKPDLWEIIGGKVQAVLMVSFALVMFIQGGTGMYRLFKAIADILDFNVLCFLGLFVLGLLTLYGYLKLNQKLLKWVHK